MGQMTIYLDAKTEKLAKLRAKASGETVSRWIAEAVRRRVRTEWPPELLSLLGSWKEDDFPEPDELRRGYGPDAPRETL